MLKKMLAACAAAGLCSFAHADNLTGNQLMDLCRGADVGSEADVCDMYLVGFISGDSAAETITMDRYNPLEMRFAPYGEKQRVKIGYDWCVPPRVTPKQQVRVVYKYLVDNPTQTNLSAAALIHLALVFGFPCK